MISDTLELIDEEPKSSGGFSDVYQGIYKGRMVAIKSLKLHVQDLTNLKKVNPGSCILIVTH
jgi:hypothetical protein